ncbi:MAG: GGDEF domain-containing protein [Gammaproteobacteria bacterium]
MRYLESRAQSSEILRLVLPAMARHEAAYHPLSYTIWYEYVAGLNPDLKRVLDQYQDDKRALSDADVFRLHALHVESRNVEASERIEATLRRVLDEMVHSTAAAGAQADEYGRSLDSYGSQLRQIRDPAALQEIVSALSRDTRLMHDSVGQLQQQLEASRRETEDLRLRLERVQSEMLTDPLTGLANRRGFAQAIEAIEAGNGQTLAGCCLLMLDIDHFKRINDTYGHLLGDRVIRAVAQVLRQSIKGGDVSTRLGGEEFAILLPRTPLDGAAALAERIRTTVEGLRIRRTDANTYIDRFTISIGVAAHRPDEGLESFMDRGDRALYRSKNGGRNRVSVDRHPAP